MLPLSVLDLLNPASSEQPPSLLVDIYSQLYDLARLITESTATSILVPPKVERWLSGVFAYIVPQLRITIASSQACTAAAPSHASLLCPQQISICLLPIVHENVRLNCLTPLSHLYQYEDVHAYIEYPESGPENPIGYLFRQDLKNWQKPWLDFAYSLRSPSGGIRAGESVMVLLLHVEDDEEHLVPCIKHYFTCIYCMKCLFFFDPIYFLFYLSGQGSKVCPNANMIEMQHPHVAASQSNVEQHLAQDIDHQVVCSSPTHDIFEKTAAFISAMRKLGCNAPLHEATVLSSSEQRFLDELLIHHTIISQSYNSKTKKYAGRLSLEYDKLGRPFVV